MLIITFVICYVLGCETFAVVEKYKYKYDTVAVKKLYSKLLQNVTNILTKEVLLLHQISSRNAVKILGVCQTIIRITIGQLAFSFAPCGRNIKRKMKFFKQTFRQAW